MLKFKVSDFGGGCFWWASGLSQGSQGDLAVRKFRVFNQHRCCRKHQ